MSIGAIKIIILLILGLGFLGLLIGGLIIYLVKRKKKDDNTGAATPPRLDQR